MACMQRPERPLLLCPGGRPRGLRARPGRALGVPKSKLSRRIALLEERLGASLVSDPRGASPSPRSARPTMRTARRCWSRPRPRDEAIALTHSEPRGIVRMTCPVALLDARVGDMLAAFMLANPRVEVHLEETNRRVDVVGRGHRHCHPRAPAAAAGQRTGDARADGPRSMPGGQPPAAEGHRDAAGAGRPGAPAEPGAGRAARRACLEPVRPRGGAGRDPPSAALRHARHAGAARRSGGGRGRRATADHDGARPDCSRHADAT